MKRLIAFIGGIALLAGLTVATPAVASATEPTSGTEVTSSHATSSSSTTAAAHSVNGVSIKSDVTVLAFVQAKGATKKQMRAKKFRLKKGRYIKTDYRTTSGGRAWHRKWYPKGYLFVKGRDGWWHDPECYNRVAIRPPKRIKPSQVVKGQVKIVKKFVFTASSKSSVDGEATATAKAWCKTDSSYAEATGSGFSRFDASAYATARGRTWAIAKANARSSSSEKLRLEGHTETNVKIMVKTDAEGDAIANAEAKAVCQETEQPPPPPPPAPEEKPMIAQITEFNDLEVNWTSDHCVTVDFPKGNSGTVFWTAKFGSFATSTKSAQDMVEVCSTYKAPSEVPAGGTDTITVTVTDSTTGLSVTQSTDPFVIHETAPHPM